MEELELLDVAIWKGASCCLCHADLLQISWVRLIASVSDKEGLDDKVART
jgi:hypothetical protein